MKTGERSNTPLLVGLFIFLLLVLLALPLFFSLFDGNSRGNVALIPLSGVLTGDGGQSYLGQPTTSSQDIVEFILQAEEHPQVRVILLEINSPGGSAVASDEIAAAVKSSDKPVVALIREVGASGGYWVASAADYVMANRMSITGSVGVLSSYLEFSGLMEEYGVGYERLVAGERKDIGTPFRKLSDEERRLLEGKLKRIHEFFIQEIAGNRNLEVEEVRRLATGEFYLGVEALELGLVDALGTRETMEEYLQQAYGLEEIDYVRYEPRRGLLEVLQQAMAQFTLGLQGVVMPQLQGIRL